MTNDVTENGTPDYRLPTSPLHPQVEGFASIDACPFGAMIKNMNVDPELLFSVLSQFFGDAGLDGADATDGTPDSAGTQM